MSVAGLDIGSGGCKCTIFNENGSISAYEFAEYELEKGSFGYMELDPNDVWDKVQEVCLKATSMHHGNRIKALCITSFGESGVLLNKKGEVIHNSLMYSDPRGEEQCIRLIEKLGRKEILQRSGHSPHPMYSASKLLWIKENEPDIYKEADAFLQYGDFILFKLTGEKKVDWSLASRSMLFNVREKIWDDVLLDGAGIEKDLFSESVQAGKAISEVLSEAARRTGFPEGTIVLLGGHDQVAAAVGAGVLKNGQAVNGMGSVDCVTPVFDRPILNEKMGKFGFACVPYVIDNHYVTYAFNFSGGSLIRWFRDKFCEAEVTLANKKGISMFDLMDPRAPDGPTGLLVLPHWQGAATPYMDINAVGAIIGMDMKVDKYVLYRAIMEGTTYEMKLNMMRLAEAKVKINRLIACGGGSRSTVWLQLRADIFNLPIDVLEVNEAGTLGSAIMAGSACGLFNSIEDGINRFVRIRKTYNPNPKTHQQYLEQYNKYELMYENIKNITKERL